MTPELELLLSAREAVMEQQTANFDQIKNLSTDPTAVGALLCETTDLAVKYDSLTHDIHALSKDAIHTWSDTIRK